MNNGKSRRQSTLLNKFETTVGNIGEAVVVNVVLKDQDDTSPVGKITVTTQNVEKVIFTIVTPDDTAVTKEEMISETTEQSTITTDFSGQMVKSVQMQLVPAGDKTSVIVRDVDIETCIGNVSTSDPTTASSSSKSELHKRDYL
uniref:Uncharacterized protein LOC111113999 n=1 Tax=Crassostrea virginica TaxID=6565 RepID=A0A8B8BX87_CRAVI|nr:uncharacterized protein LOC111113999 [Crassostrea virginica]